MPDLLRGRHFVIRTQRSRDEVQMVLTKAILPRTAWLAQFARAAADRPDFAGSVAGDRFDMGRLARYAILAPTVRGTIVDDLGGARVEADVVLLSAPQLVVLVLFGLLMAAGYALSGWCAAGFFGLILLANVLMYVIPFAGEAQKAERWLQSRLDAGGP